MSRATAFDLLKKTAMKWNQHNAPSLGASLAFYALLSLAPLVLLVVALCGFFLSRSTAEQDLIGQAQQLAGSSAANTLESVIYNSTHEQGGIIAGFFGLITLLFGASGVFVELRQSLNIIWEAPPDKTGVRTFVVQRLATFVMVLALGLLLLGSLLLSAAIGVGEHYFAEILPAGTALVGEIINILVSTFAMITLFGIIFKFVPNVKIGWRDVGVGAVVTGVLFTIGRGLLILYLATAGVGSTYGAAGSLVALVAWVYYSAQIFFFGAVFTRVYADWCRSGNTREMAAAIK